MYSLNEYRRNKINGETVYLLVANQIKLWKTETIVTVYTAGIGYDGPTDHNIFTVTLQDGRKFVTDWSGIDGLGHLAPSNSFHLVRVNEYRKTIQEDGSTALQYTDHGVRVNPLQITHVKSASTGINGGSVDCFKAYLTTGDYFITDQDGIDAIQNEWC